MVVELEQIIEDYYEEAKGDNPGITKHQFITACWAAHDFIVEMIEEPNLPTIEIIYFGTFAVYEGKIENLLSKVKIGKNAGRVSEPEFIEKWNGYKELLQKLKDNPPGSDENKYDIIEANRTLNRERQKHHMSTSVVTLLDDEDNVIYKTPD